MFSLFREEPLGSPDTPAGHSCLLYVCSWWGLSGNTKILSLVPCLLSSLFHLFFLVLASLPFPAPNCPNLSCRLWPWHYGLLLASICLLPVIMLPSALRQDLCWKCPLYAVCLPGLSRKILFPAISLSVARKVSPAERRHFSELQPSSADSEEIMSIKSGPFCPWFSPL